MAGVKIIPGESFGSALRRALWELTREIGPLMLVIFGICIAGLGGILHADGVDSLRYDDRLRATGVETVGKVVEVERYTSHTRRGTGTTRYTPITVQTVEGREYRTRLDVYEISTRGYYEVGDEIPVIYDPQNPDMAGVGNDDFRPIFERNEREGKNWALLGLALLIPGIPLGLIQLLRYWRRRWRTRKDRGWAELRRRIRSERRRDQRAKAAAHPDGQSPSQDSALPPRHRL